MHSLYCFSTPPHECAYLPAQQSSLEYELVAEITPAEYLRRMLQGWRRFGHTLFHPVCRSCRACQAMRVRVADFRPDRGQRRCWQANDGRFELHIGAPALTREKLRLHDRYHTFQSDHKGWPETGGRSAESYIESFVAQPFEVEEWCYYLDGYLVGVGYVDPLAEALRGDEGQGGLSLIYFFYDPTIRQHGLGTYNVLMAINETAQRGLPYLYLGYFVAGCGSLEYKARFRPNEARAADGTWQPFRE